VATGLTLVDPGNERPRGYIRPTYCRSQYDELNYCRMDAIPPVERLVTVREASRRLGIGRHLLYRACEAGELPIYDPGGWARVRLSDVAAWVERTRRVPRV